MQAKNANYWAPHTTKMKDRSNALTRQYMYSMYKELISGLDIYNDISNFHQ